MDDLLSQTPPDDTGTDTLERFRYQAQLALPFCLDCASTKGEVISVIMEHFEDIVVEYKDHWHFIQVKSRNASRGPWKLSDAWGGLKSLFRAYNQTHHLTASYSLFLEGAIAQGNEIQNLINQNGSFSVPTLKKGAEEFNTDIEDCQKFLEIVSIRPDQPSRAEIKSHNIQLLGQVASSLSVQELQAHEENLTDKILKAMSAECLGDNLYEYMSSISSTKTKENLKVRAKRLDSDSVSAILGSLIYGRSPLLKRPLVEVQNSTRSVLEQKLLAGGGSQRIIERAKALRATTAIRELEILSSGLFGGEELEDAQERLLTLATAIIELHDEKEKPAKLIWHALLKELKTERELVDPNRLYFQDAFYLLGAVCELSDQCLIDWGVPLA